MLTKRSECRSNIDDELRRWHLSQHIGSVQEQELMLNHMTLPRNNLSDYGSVRSIDMTWGRTGVRVGRANTCCILAGRRNSRREMQ